MYSAVSDSLKALLDRLTNHVLVLEMHGEIDRLNCRTKYIASQAPDAPTMIRLHCQRCPFLLLQGHHSERYNTVRHQARDTYSLPCSGIVR